MADLEADLPGAEAEGAEELALPATFSEFRSALTHAGLPQEHVCQARKPISGSRTPETPAMALRSPLESEISAV